MKPNFKPIPAAITAPSGFLAGSVFCDIKRLGTGKGSNKGRKKDLAVLMSETPATVAGLFTTNQVCAAPVKVSVIRAARNRAQAIVANSGNGQCLHGETGNQGCRGHDRRGGAFHSSQARGGFGLLHRPNRGSHADGQCQERHRRGQPAFWPARKRQAMKWPKPIMTSDTRKKESAVGI